MRDTFPFPVHRQRRWLLAALLLLAGLCGAGCTYQSATAPGEDADFSDEPQQVSQHVRFTVNDGEQPRAEIIAAEMARYEREDSTYTLLHGAPGADSTAIDTSTPDTAAPGAATPDTAAAGRVTAHLFNASGDSSAVITANEMTYWEKESRFEARGRVIVTTAEGKRLEAEHLAWDEKARRVRTPGFVRITTPADRMQGYGFDADEDLNNYRLRDVTGETTIEE